MEPQTSTSTEQNNTTNPSTPEVSESPESGAERSRGPLGVIAELFGGKRGERNGDHAAEPQDQPAASAPAPDEANAWKPPTSVEEERRRLQSYYDSRRYQEQREERERTLAGLEQQLEAALDEDDPLTVTELERQIRALKSGDQAQDQVSTVVGNLTAFYDELYLDGGLKRLPMEVRQQLLSDAGQVVGPQGRQQLATRIYDAVLAEGKRQGAAEEAKRLRSSSAFRKEILHQNRDEEEEPDYVPAVAGGGRARSMNDFMRELS
jgi:hypothetical protein